MPTLTTEAFDGAKNMVVGATQTYVLMRYTMKNKESPKESQLRTRCAILESQVEVLKRQVEVLEEQNKDFCRP